MLSEIEELALLPPVPLSTEEETSQESDEEEEEEEKQTRPTAPLHLVNDNAIDIWESVEEASSEESSDDSSSSSLVSSVLPTVPFLSLREMNRRQRIITAAQEVQNITARTVNTGHRLFQTRVRGRGSPRGLRRGYGRVRRLRGRGRSRGRGRGSRTVIFFSPSLLKILPFYSIISIYHPLALQWILGNGSS